MASCKKNVQSVVCKEGFATEVQEVDIKQSQKIWPIILYTDCIRRHTEKHIHLRSHTVSVNCWHLSPINHSW